MFLNIKWHGKNAVEKIVVINKEIAQIYVKQDALDDSDLKDDPNGILSSGQGPHYYITIGSVESFEDKLERAQEDAGISEKLIFDMKTEPVGPRFYHGWCPCSFL